jgi:hypothetical protein
MRQYTSKNYQVECFVDKATFMKLRLRCWQLLDPDMLHVIDTLTKYYGKRILINNWKEGGSFQYRAFRPAGCGVGSVYGAHYLGRGIDFNVPDIPPAQVQIDLVKNSELWPAITRMEELAATPTWTHIDNGNRLTESPGIYIFKP